MFSLKTFTWRTIQDKNNICTYKFRLNPYNNTYLNGAIYWTVKSHKPSIVESHYNPSIIYFDLAEEIFHELPWPEAAAEKTADYHLSELGISGEHLCLSLPNHSNLCVELWVMKESCWTISLTISYFKNIFRPRPILLSNRNNIDELLILTGLCDYGDCSGMRFGDCGGMRLIMYTSKEKTRRTIFKPRQPEKDQYQPLPVIAVATCVESLYSLLPDVEV